jgi:hypothetical protein
MLPTMKDEMNVIKEEDEDGGNVNNNAGNGDAQAAPVEGGGAEIEAEENTDPTGNQA